MSPTYAFLTFQGWADDEEDSDEDAEDDKAFFGMDKDDDDDNKKVRIYGYQPASTHLNLRPRLSSLSEVKDVRRLFHRICGAAPATPPPR